MKKVIFAIFLALITISSTTLADIYTTEERAMAGSNIAVNTPDTIISQPANSNLASPEKMTLLYTNSGTADTHAMIYTFKMASGRHLTTMYHYGTNTGGTIFNQVLIARSIPLTTRPRLKLGWSIDYYHRDYGNYCNIHGSIFHFGYTYKLGTIKNGTLNIGGSGYSDGLAWDTDKYGFAASYFSRTKNNMWEYRNYQFDMQSEREHLSFGAWAYLKKIKVMAGGWSNNGYKKLTAGITYENFSFSLEHHFGMHDNWPTYYPHNILSFTYNVKL